VIELPFPAKVLWPNGRGHWAVKAKAIKAHRQWAFIATLAYYGNREKPVLPITLRYTITPLTAHEIDRDNAVAACKSYQDGVAQALKIDDKEFGTPEIRFADPQRPGKIIVQVLQ